LWLLAFGDYPTDGFFITKKIIVFWIYYNILLSTKGMSKNEKGQE
jgi:hypothetical protein